MTVPSTGPCLIHRRRLVTVGRDKTIRIRNGTPGGTTLESPGGSTAFQSGRRTAAHLGRGPVGTKNWTSQAEVNVQLPAQDLRLRYSRWQTDVAHSGKLTSGHRV